MSVPSTPRSRALPLVAVLAVALIAGCSKKPQIDLEESATLVQPVAKFELQVVKVEPGKRTGEEIYKNTCSACHGSGALGAPKFGNAGDWGPRIAQGYDTLITNATNGKNQMPPKGGAADLTDKEIARALAYMANAGGAKFTPPPVE